MRDAARERRHVVAAVVDADDQLVFTEAIADAAEIRTALPAVAVHLVAIDAPFAEENLGAVNVELTADDLSAIETASSHIKIEGARYPEFHEKLVGR